MCKALCKSKDRVATENKNNIFYGTVCSKCDAVLLNESKQSQNCDHINTRNRSKIAIVKRLKYQTIVGEKIITLTGIIRKLLIKTVG